MQVLSLREAGTLKSQVAELQAALDRTKAAAIDVEADRAREVVRLRVSVVGGDKRCAKGGRQGEGGGAAEGEWMQQEGGRGRLT